MLRPIIEFLNRLLPPLGEQDRQLTRMRADNAALKQLLETDARQGMEALREEVSKLQGEQARLEHKRREEVVQHQAMMEQQQQKNQALMEQQEEKSQALMEQQQQKNQVLMERQEEQWEQQQEQELGRHEQELETVKEQYDDELARTIQKAKQRLEASKHQGAERLRKTLKQAEQQLEQSKQQLEQSKQQLEQGKLELGVLKEQTIRDEYEIDSLRSENAQMLRTVRDTSGQMAAQWAEAQHHFAVSLKNVYVASNAMRNRPIQLFRSQGQIESRLQELADRIRVLREQENKLAQLLRAQSESHREHHTVVSSHTSEISSLQLQLEACKARLASKEEQLEAVRHSHDQFNGKKVAVLAQLWFASSLPDTSHPCYFSLSRTTAKKPGCKPC